MIGDVLPMILFGLIVPVVLFIIGLVYYPTKKKRGKMILIIAAVYSIVSFGICGGFGF